MEMGSLVGLLAIVTIGLVGIFAVLHFTRQLRDPRNKGRSKEHIGRGRFICSHGGARRKRARTT